MRNIRVIRYRTTSETAAGNSDLIAEVYGELGRSRPAAFRYGTLLLPEENTFIHIAINDGADPSPLPDLPAFREFQRELGSRIIEPVVAREARIVGSYRLY